MSRRHRKRELQEPMEPFVQTPDNSNVELAARMRASGFSDREIEAHLAIPRTIYVNNRYTVIVRDIIDGANNNVRHLSIRRNDRDIIVDWRELQMIKNSLAGEERAGVQVFPKESNLHDSANQYHLWVFMNDDFELSFGFKGREVGTPEDAAAHGAVQRKF